MLFNLGICLQTRQYRQNALVEVYFIWRKIVHFLIKRKIFAAHFVADHSTNTFQRRNI